MLLWAAPCVYGGVSGDLMEMEQVEDGRGPVPECPRCGYDQSGMVAAWKDRCPLTGMCSECGLVFAWREVLSPSFLGPRWSFEHGLRPSSLRWLSTLWRALVPGAMWRWLGMGHVVKRGRLLRFILPIPIAMHFVLAEGAIL